MAKHPKKSEQGKSWNRRTARSKSYAVGSKAVYDKRFFIVCEGKNTEPCYFESFRVVTAEVEVTGAGRSKTSLVEHVIQLVKDRPKDSTEEVWIVFDMDHSPLREKAAQDQDFNRAVHIAEARGFKVAYSNDSFELWFILHHQLLESALTRTEYYAAISDHWKVSYERDGKNKAFCKTIYDRLLPHQNNAIRHAERLHRLHSENPPAAQNPCTTVYKLVTELNKYLKK